ncbi:hypothetical protein E4T56_gene10240 [Termitomyces sp. T112]|nr:hypothetical protein E4T56_gene10240 [Termitomyces sp. T112]
MNSACVLRLKHSYNNPGPHSAWPRNPSCLGDLPSNSGSAPINRKASAYPTFYLHTHELVLVPVRAFYAPSISQGIPLGWHCPPAFSANGNNPCIYPEGYSAALPNPAYLPPAHYYAYPVPTAAPTPPGPMDNYSPPRMPFPAQAPPSPRQQRVEVYAQQHDEVLRFLHLSPMEFARCTCTLLTNLGYPDTFTTPEVWNELCTLVEEIHTSPNPCPFEDPLDPTHSFHVQCKEPVGTQSKAPPSVPRQQEELNVASSILRNLNPVGGLFNQPAAHILALSAHPQANSVPSAFQIWDQPAISEPCSHRPPPRIDDDNQTLSYIDKPGPGAPRPPFLTNHPRPPPALMPNPPADANYFGPPIPGGPPQWAPGPALGNVGQPPGGGPPNSRLPGGWGLAMDNFPPQRENGNNYYYYYNARPLP